MFGEAAPRSRLDSTSLSPQALAVGHVVWYAHLRVCVVCVTVVSLGFSCVFLLLPLPPVRFSPVLLLYSTGVTRCKGP